MLSPPESQTTASKSLVKDENEINYELEIEVLKRIYLAKMATKKNPELIVDSGNQQIICQLVRHFRSDEETGVMLVGFKGTGKTMLMRLFSFYCKFYDYKAGYPTHNVDYLTYLYRTKGEIGLNEFTYNVRETNGENISMKPIDVCIDDMGLEKTSASSYGDKENVISLILNTRYSLNEYRIKTHATTNLDAKQLTDHYKERLASRFNEMFTIYDMPATAKDRRL